MARTVHSAARKAKTPTEAGFGKSRSMIRSGAFIALVAKQIWPDHTAKRLAAAAGVHPRTAELWLAGEAPKFESFLALLWSEHGDAFYRAAMEEAPRAPLHWIALKREMRIAAVRQAEIDAKRERQRLEEGGDA